MLYFASKVAYIVVMPIFWVLFLLALALFKKKYRALFLFLGIALLLLFSNPVFVNHFMLKWEVPPTPLTELEDKKYDVGIVLSGVTNNTKLPRDRTYLRHGGDRVMHAVMLYKMKKIKNIIITGSYTKVSGEKLGESEAMKNLMLLSGVKEKDIIIEQSSRNTYESAIQTKELLKGQFPEKQYLLITSAFHMRRSLACYEKQGIKVDGFSTDFYTSDAESDWSDWIGGMLPSEHSFFVFSKLVHEVFGFYVYKALGRC
ncbi:YdcF family protein [Sediminitomix flava]|uniref:Uncharacterized SAM-binding protein YcdF (DUF218 family) n=1 Tax=Sediminitomix flava TaxID=379075 RepID=A0A315ZT67_SEDFL|nr:YdcF family protein [Sediminitomix flava]PWJ38414.1 uncharacterized SAM-binding protein YcdF (DUF218 family) [Sediminitomix flava]